MDSLPRSIRSNAAAHPAPPGGGDTAGPAAAFHRRHALLAAAGLALAGGLGWLLPAPGPGPALIAAALAVAVFGLPHGAYDRAVLRRLEDGPGGGSGSPGGATALYVGLIAVGLAAWLLAPLATLAVFLAIAWGHFGAEDAAALMPGRPAGRGQALRRLAAAVALGGAPILLPLLLRPEETLTLMALLLPEAVRPAFSGAVGPAVRAAAVLWFAGVAVLTLTAAGRPGLARRVRRKAELAAEDEAGALDPLSLRRGARAGVAQLAGLALAVAALPVPLAFALYFCGVHSARHVLALAAARDPKRPGRAAADLLRASAGATLLTAGVAGAAAILLPPLTGLDPETGLARTLFWGLAALTLPHVALERAMAWRGSSVSGPAGE